MTIEATMHRMHAQYKVDEANIEALSVSQWFGSADKSEHIPLGDVLGKYIDTLIVIENKYYELLQTLAGGDTLPECKYQDICKGLRPLKLKLSCIKSVSSACKTCKQ